MDENESSPFAPEVREAWEAEIARRLESIDRGEAKWTSWEDLRARLIARIEAARKKEKDKGRDPTRRK